MTLKYQNKALLATLEDLKRKLHHCHSEKDCVQNQSRHMAKVVQEFKDIWKKSLNSLEQTYNVAKKGNENRLLNKFQLCFKYLDQFLDQCDLEQTEEMGSNKFIKNVHNLFVEIFVELRRNYEESQNYIQSFMEKQELNDRVRMIFEQSKNTDKKYREIEARYSANLKELQELQKQNESMQQKVKDHAKCQEQCEKQEQINQVLMKRLFIKQDYDVQKVNQSIMDGMVCVCMGNPQTIQIQQSIQNHNNNSNQQQQQQQQSINNNKMNESDELCMDDKYKGLLEEYKLKTNENQQLIKTIQDYENNIEEIFYQSEAFQVVIHQTQKLNEQNIKMKNRIRQLEGDIQQIEVLRNKEIEELEKIANFNLNKSQNEVRQIKIEKSVQMKDCFDIYSHVKPLVEGLELSNKNIENIKKERDVLFDKSKMQQSEINELKEKKQMLEEKMNDYKCQQIIIKECNNIDYDQLSYKGGRFKEIINELNKIIIKDYGHYKQRFDDLILYLKTREQKIEYLENKNKLLQKDVKANQKQQEDLILEIDLTAKNYQDILQKNRKLVKQIKDQEETFDQLAKEKFKEKQKLEGDKNTLQSKVKVDQDLIQSQNQLIYDLEYQLGSIQSSKKQMECYTNNMQKQIEEYQKQQVSDKENIQQKQFELDQLRKNQKKNEETAEDQQNTICQLNLQIQVLFVETIVQEIHKFIERKIQNKKQNQKEGVDEMETLQQMEHQQFKRKINCSVCQKESKQVILSKCCHMFCKKCVEKSLAVRNRACPICKSKFGLEDIKEIYFS